MLVTGPHTMFVAGDDAAAKAQAGELLKEFGWPAASILDLGDITAARGTEMYLALWLRLWGAAGTPDPQRRGALGRRCGRVTSGRS